jgi:TRAP-type C4-dicarboxylate transport system substrate-binding protein
MNKAKWAKLSPDIQKTILNINAEWAQKHGRQWDASDADGREFFTSRGGKFVKLDPAETARWKAAVAPITEAYVKETAAKQMDGKAVVDYITAALSSPN